MSSNRYKVLFSNTAVFAVGNILVKLIAFFLMPLYTSALTTEEYGVSELLNSTTEIIIPLATVCIIEALYRFAIDKDADYKTLFANSLRIILLGDIAVLIGCVIAKQFFGYTYSYYFFTLYICTTVYKLTTQFARGLGHVKRYAFYGVLNALMLVLCNVILLLELDGGIEAYLLSFAIAYGVAGVTAFVISGEYKYFYLRVKNTEQLKAMLKYSIPTIPNMISWWINSVSDRYILLFFWNTGIVGMYTAASKLPAMINLVSSIFQQAWQYSTAKEIESKDRTEFFSVVLRGYLYLCTCACGLLVIFNKLICGILLKKEFYESWKFVPLLLLAATFGCISTYFGTFYQALKNNVMLMISTVAGAIMNMILNFMLIPISGGLGAAIATVISYIIVAAIRVVDVRKKIEFSIGWKRVGTQLIALTAMVLIETYINANWSYAIEIVCIVVIVLSDFRLLKYIFRKLMTCFSCQ